MTPDERNLLNDLANKIAQTPPPPKDPEAEDFIRTHIGSRPDALYLMTQTVVIQNIALQHAQQQIQELQQRAGQPAPVGSGSFLGQGQQPGASGYAQRPAQPPPPQYAPPSPGGPAPAPSGAPGFLRGAAQTAAGVAAGALAFEGISSLFGHSGYGGGGFMGGGGGFMGGGGMGGAPIEETVNNYYDNPADAGPNDYQAGGGNDLQNAADDGGVSTDSGQYDDANYDAGDDGGGFDDNSGGGDFA